MTDEIQYIAPPPPEPPTEGWWLDPDDSSLVRYHDGEQWTDRVGRSTAPRPGMPARQGIFLPGAGPDGIPTGEPLAPGRGRYVSRGSIWGFVALLTVGLIIFSAGFALTGPARALALVIGAPMFFGPLVYVAVSAWRAGYRPPGFSRGASKGARQMGRFWLAAVIGVLLYQTMPLFTPGSVASEWHSRLLVFVTLYLVIGLGRMIPDAVREQRSPKTRIRDPWFYAFMAFVALMIIVGVGVILWDRLLPAFWLAEFPSN